MICNTTSIMKWFCAVGMAAVLAGCASTPTHVKLAPVENPDQAWEVRKATLAGLREWAMNGRFALKSPNNAWTSKVHWQQMSEAFDINFSTILGLHTAQVEGDSQGASVHLYFTSAGDSYELTGPDVSTIATKYLGYAMSVDGMRYWVLGLPAPGSPMTRTLDMRGRLQRLDQSGWRIDYKEYQVVGDLELPKKVVLSHPKAHVAVIIDHWSLQAR